MKKWTKEERYRVLRSADEIRPLHEKTVQSDYRQHYHIQSVTGLLNDPNGFVFHNGVWHLFYQWCPWGAVHGLKYWYHTVSEDLVTWKNMGACIFPDTEYDNKGAYSGSALPTDNSVYLYYTGNHRDEDWTRKSYTCLVNLRDRRLIQQPIDELRALRGKKLDLESTDVLPRVCELELICRGGDMSLRLFADADGNGGIAVTYDDAAKEITVDRSGMKRRFNTELGEQRVRPLPKGLFHLRFFIDRSSVEIFVNDGDAVFSSRVFPTEGEDRLIINGDASVHLWELNRAVEDDFVV